MGRGRVLLAVPILAGCAVAPLPAATALRNQTARDQAWDRKECRWEAQRASNYDPAHSPLVNFIQDVFFWGTAGAALGGTLTGFPAAAGGEATEGLVAGAGAGGLVAGGRAVRGREGFERAYVACLESRGYAVAAVKKKEEGR